MFRFSIWYLSKFFRGELGQGIIFTGKSFIDEEDMGSALSSEGAFLRN
jgi:hypothetical protein